MSTAVTRQVKRPESRVDLRAASATASAGAGGDGPWYSVRRRFASGVVVESAPTAAAAAAV